MGNTKNGWPATFGDGVVCHNQQELDQYLVGTNHVPIEHGGKMENAYIEAASVALQVLEAIRATNPALIADHMPDGWGMNKLREGLQIQPQFEGAVETTTGPTEALVTLNLNVFDSAGNMVEATAADLAIDQVSDIINQANKLILICRSGRRSSGDTESVIAKLEDALSVSGVIDIASA